MLSKRIINNNIFNFKNIYIMTKLIEWILYIIAAILIVPVAILTFYAIAGVFVIFFGSVFDDVTGGDTFFNWWFS